MHPVQSTAVRAAEVAGDIIMSNYDRRDSLEVETKSANDFVSAVDRGAESAIVETLRNDYPEHGVMGEESEASRGDGIHEWVIDPLDGTRNFLLGFPHFAVSIAFKVHETLEFGVVYDPFKKEMFMASRGNGATLNGKPLQVSQCGSLDGAITATGFPFRNPALREKHGKLLTAILERSHDIRRAGSAALDLAYVAAGRLDGYWEFDLNEWDIAAGSLLVSEAGGMVGDFEGSDTFLRTGDIVAAPSRVFDDFLKAARCRDT